MDFEEKPQNEPHPHSHIQQYMDVEGKTVINPGAVGVAQHSENGKSQFMILTSEENGWNHEFISVDYDKERTIKDLHESGLYEKTPYWCQITEHLINNSKSLDAYEIDNWDVHDGRNGTYRWIAVDAAGNESVMSETFTIKYDGYENTGTGGKALRPL